jgi:hypothetical protein
MVGIGSFVDRTERHNHLGCILLEEGLVGPCCLGGFEMGLGNLAGFEMVLGSVMRVLALWIGCWEQVEGLVLGKFRMRWIGIMEYEHALFLILSVFSQLQPFYLAFLSRSNLTLFIRSFCFDFFFLCHHLNSKVKDTIPIKNATTHKIGTTTQRSAPPEQLPDDPDLDLVVDLLYDLLLDDVLALPTDFASISTVKNKNITKTITLISLPMLNLTIFKFILSLK